MDENEKKVEEIGDLKRFAESLDLADDFANIVHIFLNISTFILKSQIINLI
jgi:hypothetical protein